MNKAIPIKNWMMLYLPINRRIISQATESSITPGNFAYHENATVPI